MVDANSLSFIVDANDLPTRKIYVQLYAKSSVGITVLKARVSVKCLCVVEWWQIEFCVEGYLSIPFSRIHDYDLSVPFVFTCPLLLFSSSCVCGPITASFLKRLARPKASDDNLCSHQVVDNMNPFRSSLRLEVKQNPAILFFRFYGQFWWPTPIVQIDQKCGGRMSCGQRSCGDVSCNSSYFEQTFLDVTFKNGEFWIYLRRAAESCVSNIYCSFRCCKISFSIQ